MVCFFFQTVQKVQKMFESWKRRLWNSHQNVSKKKFVTILSIIGGLEKFSNIFSSNFFLFLKVKEMGIGKILIIIQTTNAKYSNYFFIFYQFIDISINYSLHY